MKNRAATLKKQALERWNFNAPKDEQKKLIEELRAWPRGQAVIELQEPEHEWNDGMPTNRFRSKAQVIPIAFGIHLDPGTTKRYLMLSDIPQPAEESKKP